MPRLALDGVTKRYGDVVALEDVSIEVATSGFQCLLGPNGTGKTTLLRLLLGLERPTAGAIDREGVTVGSGFQRPCFYPSLSVRENLDVFAHVRDVDDGDWRERLVERLHLRPVLDRRAGDLSGGFARKLDLALALQHRPDVALLDEPLGALDDVASERVLAFLRDYADEGNAVLVSTHRIASFEPHFDRLVVLHDGSVIYDGERGDREPAAASIQEWYVDLVLDSAESPR